MKGIGLAPSPNWYCSKVSDCNRAGIFAFGAKQDVALLDVAAQVPSYTGLLVGHRDKIAGLKFCPNPNRLHELVSVDESGTVKIWDVSAKTVLVEFSVPKNKITCIDWSSGEADTIVTGDEKGLICVYNSKDDLIQQHPIQKNQISTILVSEHDAQFLLVGFREGLILIFNLKTFCLMHSLRRHENDVQCLSWIPHSFNRKSFFRAAEIYEGELLFASSSKDGTIRFWNTNQGKLLNTLKLPSPSGYRAKYHDGQAKTRLWSTLFCSSRWNDAIICSGHNGELLLCNLQDDGKHKWEVLNKHDGPIHQNIIFNISNYETYLCTTSIDRQIIIWDLNQKKSLTSLPTLGGFVYCLQFSPVDIGSLAIGVGDNSIRIWNMQSSIYTYQVDSLWHGIKAKVTAIAWHPRLEGILAFGTDEGRIGIFNLLSSRSSKISDTYHRSTVYSISWGPTCDSNPKINKKSSEFCLYTCGGGEILIHNPKNLKETAQNINTIMTSDSYSMLKAPSRSELSWREDMNFLAIGNEDGSIEILKVPNLVNILTITELRKQIQCLCWHPIYTASNVLSECRFWLAAAGCGSMVHVFDLKQELENTTSSSVTSINKISCKLDGHKNRVVSLCWSPHSNGQLASASYDGTAQIWDVIHKKPLANFRGHRGRIFSLAWSPLNPDIVFTGGEDFSLQQWNISKQQHASPPKKVVEKNNKKNKKQKANAVAVAEASSPKANEAVSEITVMDELQDLLQKKKMEILSKQIIQETKKETVDANIIKESPAKKQLDLQEIKIESAEENVSVTHEPSNKKKKRKKYKSLFPNSSSLENRGKAFTLRDIHSLFMANYKSIVQDNIPTESSEEVNSETDEFPEDNSVSDVFDIENQPHLGLFTTRIDAFRMIKAESKYHRENANIESILQLEIWKGNIGKAIDIACERKHLTDWLVALAPLGSYALWKKACQAYSVQLVSEGQPLRASLYLLAIHDVYGAIDVLKTHASYKEALALARVRLSPDDPKLYELIAEWKDSLIKEDNFEGASKCLIAVKNFKDAVQMLTRRNDPAALKLAACLSLKMGDVSEAEMLALKSLRFYQEKTEWDTAREIINGHPSLQNYNIFLSCNQHLYEKVELLKNDLKLWQLKSVIDIENICIWEPHLIGKPFIQTLLEEWRSENSKPRISCPEESMQIYDWLQDQNKSGQILTSVNEIILQCAYHLSLILMASIAGNLSLVLFNFMQILHLCENEESSFLLQMMSCLFFPNGLITIDDLSKSLEISRNTTSADKLMAKSIKAYYSFSVLHFLKNIKLPILEEDSSYNEDSENQKKNDDFCNDLNKFQSHFNSSFFSANTNLQNIHEHLIESLMAVLLDDCRAELNSLQLDLKYINNSITQAHIRKKLQKKIDGKTDKSSANENVQDSSSLNEAGDRTSKNVELTILDSEKSPGKSSAAALINAMNVETNVVATNTSSKHINKDDEASVPEFNSENSENSGIIAEKSTVIDYSLPRDKRYINVQLQDLEKERARIGKKLEQLDIPKDHHFPDPMKAAEMLLKYCQNNELNHLKNVIVEWVLKYAMLSETKDNV